MRTACPGRACPTPVLAPSRSSLTQIRRSYVTDWQDRALRVESGLDCWTVRVLLNGQILYEAHRGTLAAAKAAGLEFAMFHAGGCAAGNPERLAGALLWKQNWLG